MGESLRALARMLGSLGGQIGGGVLLGWLSYDHFCPPSSRGDPDQDLFALMIFGIPAFLIGSIIGAASGATVTQRILGQRSSFWKALLGATVGSILPGIGAAIGAFVASSGTTKAKPIPLSTGTWPPAR